MTNLENLIKNGKVKVTHPDKQQFYNKYTITIDVDHEHYLRTYQLEKDYELDVLEWLSKEYEEPIELSQLEHDLLENYFDYTDIEFINVKALVEMRKAYGYFKKIPWHAKIIDVLNNCTVKEDDFF